jgi:type I restriction enzyme S subunit
MEVKPGYKQTEVGAIPEDWNAKPLHEDILLLSGHHVLARNCNVQGDGFPYLTGPADFPNGVIHQTKFTNNPTTLCQEGDILVTVKGSGSGTLIESDASYCISRQLMAIRVKEWDAKFLFYSLLQNASRIKDASTGLIPGLSRSDILNQKIPLPPLHEQRSIAAALSDVDALIKALDKLIAKKRDIKQAAMQELLTGRRRLPRFEGERGYKQTEVGFIPREWDIITLGELFTFKNGLNKNKEYFGHGTPIVNYMDVYKRSGIHESDLKGRVSLTRQEIKTYEVRKGDVFFTRTSETVDEIGIASVMLDDPKNTVFSGFVLRARPKNDLLDNHFKSYCFASKDVRRSIVSTCSYTTRALTNGRLLSAVIIPLPPILEQTAIASVLSDMDAEITALEASRDKTKALKQGMMQELLTGRIRLVEGGAA